MVLNTNYNIIIFILNSANGKDSNKHKKKNNNLEDDEFEMTVAQTRRMRKRNDQIQYNS